MTKMILLNKINRSISTVKDIAVLNIKRNYSMIASREKVNPLMIEDMPHPKGLPIFGTKIDLLLAGSGVRLHHYIDGRHKQLGSIFYEKLGGTTKLVFISDPKMMKSLFLNLEGKYPVHILPDPWVFYEKLHGNKRGLFFMNGEDWLSHRQIMNKFVLKENTSMSLEDPIIETINKFIKSWQAKSEHGTFVPNLESELYRFSIDVIVSILLGKKSLYTTKQYDMLLEMFSNSVKKIFKTTTKLYGLPIEYFHGLNLKAWRDFKECVDMSISLGQKLVGEMLLKRDENEGLIKLLTQENVSDEIITRIVADFVIAAGDTTAFTTLWILYLISRNKEVVNEIRNRDKTYVNYVVKEVMRLYPVAPFLTRILPKVSLLENYKLEAGTPIIASIFTSGRDNNNFTKADQFLPYRWDRKDPRKEELTNHVPSASLPFALGARSCIGKKIALIQMTELIYQIVNNFDMQFLNKGEVKPITSQVLVPDQEIKIAFSLKHKQ